MAVVAIQTQVLRVRAATLGHEVETDSRAPVLNPFGSNYHPKITQTRDLASPPPARGCHRARHFGPYLKIRLVKVSWM